MKFCSRVEVLAPGGDRWLFTTHAEHAKKLVETKQAVRRGKKAAIRQVELVPSKAPGNDYDLPSRGSWTPTFWDEVTRPSPCGPCDGSGLAERGLSKKCRSCGGTGVVRKIVGYYLDLATISDAIQPFFTPRHLEPVEDTDEMKRKKLMRKVA